MRSPMTYRSTLGRHRVPHTERRLPAEVVSPTWPTLLAWLENDLPDEEAQLLNTHVADCDECRVTQTPSRYQSEV